jgi:hypothetical protein
LESLPSTSSAELAWRVLGFVNALRVLASATLAVVFVTIMPATVGQLDPALFAGAATAYFLYAFVSLFSIGRRSPDIILQTWTGVFADVLVLSLLTYASGGVNGGMAALLVLSIGAASFILRGGLALSTAGTAAVAVLLQPGLTLLADVDSSGDFATAGISAALIVIVSLGVTQLSRTLRQNEDLARVRELTAAEQNDLSLSIAQNLREGVLVVDGDNNVPMISQKAAMLLLGGDVLPGTPLADVSPRLLNLLDTWRRFFCDEQRSTPTMSSFDGTKKVQLKFVSLDSSSQGPTLVFVDEKVREAAPAPQPAVAAVPEQPPIPVAMVRNAANAAFVAPAVSPYMAPSVGASMPPPVARSAPPPVSAYAPPAVNPYIPPPVQSYAPPAASASPPVISPPRQRAAEPAATVFREVPPPSRVEAPVPRQMRAAAERRVNAVVQSPRKRVESVTSTDRRLRIIVGNALQFGRRDSARVERVDLAAWSKEFITEFWQAEEIDAATVRLSAPRDTVYVRVDPAHLHRLLWTLCGDLLKYGRIDRAPDPVELRVGRSATTQRRYLDVIDRGRIASMPDARRVFEPFMAVGKVGAGIALFVSRELAPGSRSSAASELRPGGGVVFRFVFADAQRKAS